jgi:hypothetical protein
MDEKLVAIDDDWVLERGEQSCRNYGRLGHPPTHEDCELIATKAGDGVSLANHFSHAFADVAECVVARKVTRRVVDLLEVVDVDEQNTDELIGVGE